MNKIYNKEVINDLQVNLFNQDYKVIVLDNPEQDTYDVHIITDRYKKDELNTLVLQEPKGDVSVDKFDKLYLTMTATEFALWDKLYGYNNKVYSFNVEIADEFEV